MNLKEIMAIAGKPGLYRMIAQAKNGIIVESIIDKKRMQAFTHDKISTLEEISVYTESGDTQLKDILVRMFNKLEGKPAPDYKGDNNKIKTFFAEILPEYDKERVYVSHMQKIINWYNLLLEHNLLDADTSTDNGNESENTEPVVDKENTPQSEEKPKVEKTKKSQEDTN